MSVDSLEIRCVGIGMKRVEGEGEGLGVWMTPIGEGTLWRLAVSCICMCTSLGVSITPSPAVKLMLTMLVQMSPNDSIPNTNRRITAAAATPAASWYVVHIVCLSLKMAPTLPSCWGVRSS
jgi:hypothetical protein